MPLSKLGTLLLALALSLLPAAPLSAATTTLVVDTAIEQGAAGDTAANCTLGDAVETANTDTVVDGCTHPSVGSGGPFEIVLPPGSGPYTIAIGAPSGNNALPEVASEIVVFGNGNVIQRAAGSPSFRIFEIENDGDLTLHDTTVAGGKSFDGGGGISSAGQLQLFDSRIEDDEESDGGGGLEIESGETRLVRTTVSNNRTSEDGGGIRVIGAGAALTAVNSTISGNSAEDERGGGIYVTNSGSATLVNTTVADNDADSDGGGIFAAPGTSVTLRNSIVAGNRLTGGNPNDCRGFGTISSQGHNLVGDGTGCPSGGIGDQTVAPALVFTTVLDVLADYGGPTQTHRPYHGSPAVDGGDPAGCTDALGAPLTADQRGYPRPDGAACDIGAVERVICPCFGPDLPVPLYCFDRHFPSLNSWVYSPGRFEQVTPLWCRNNALFKWVTPLQSDRCDLDLHTRCH